MGFSYSYTCIFCTKDSTYEQVDVIPVSNGFSSCCSEEIKRECNELKCSLCGKKGNDLSQIRCSGDFCYNIATIRWVKKSKGGECLSF